MSSTVKYGVSVVAYPSLLLLLLLITPNLRVSLLLSSFLEWYVTSDTKLDCEFRYVVSVEVVIADNVPWIFKSPDIFTAPVKLIVGLVALFAELVIKLILLPLISIVLLLISIKLLLTPSLFWILIFLLLIRILSLRKLLSSLP